jgi:hypothetical protein
MTGNIRVAHGYAVRNSKLTALGVSKEMLIRDPATVVLVDIPLSILYIWLRSLISWYGPIKLLNTSWVQSFHFFFVLPVESI